MFSKVANGLFLINEVPNNGYRNREVEANDYQKATDNVRGK